MKAKAYLTNDGKIAIVGLPAMLNCFHVIDGDECIKNWTPLVEPENIRNAELDGLVTSLKLLKSLIDGQNDNDLKNIFEKVVNQIGYLERILAAGTKKKDSGSTLSFSNKAPETFDKKGFSQLEFKAVKGFRNEKEQAILGAANVFEWLAQMRISNDVDNIIYDQIRILRGIIEKFPRPNPYKNDEAYNFERQDEYE